jgi:hypothetical protein
MDLAFALTADTDNPQYNGQLLKDILATQQLELI